MDLPPLDHFWKIKGFNPNESQREAILHTAGPLFLTAGPGSGKTRVLLWRTLNLIVFEKIDPKKIFLATFTEKAAHQLKEGLRSLLGLVTNQTGVPYDISGMSVGTVHSICQNILIDPDRRFTIDGNRSRPPVLLDELSQYFKIYNKRYWLELLASGGYYTGSDPDKEQEVAQREITKYLYGRDIYSRHLAATNLIKLFNRFSEENLDPGAVNPQDATLAKLLKMYSFYCESHRKGERIETVDFSLLQQKAFNKVKAFDGAQHVYEHIIVDEYQDTNSIQEQIYFELAKKCKNICVVGDDDQALYRFRGATVENLVEFESRCEKYLKVKPRKISLSTNYRSKKLIVDFYCDFIKLANWKKDNGDGHYRVIDKNIQAHNQETLPAVVATKKKKKEEIFREVAQFVFDLKEKGKIQDYSQVAFLFPSLKSMGEKNTKVSGFEDALNELGIPVFAPRAGRFLEVREAVEIFGLIFSIVGRPRHQGKASEGLQSFRNWQNHCLETADKIVVSDSLLAEYISDRRAEIGSIVSDYNALMNVVTKKKWDIEKSLKLEMMRDLASASGLSAKSKAILQKTGFNELLKKRQQAGQPVNLKYVLNRVTSVDWSVLDLFYQLNGFKHFQKMYDLAERGIDEGPVCNLGLVTQYLARFMEEYSPIITASFLSEDRFANTFVGSYLYAIYRLGEQEFEDTDDPFPKGRVPFLTIHQAKGLEFPYVVMGSLRKDERAVDTVEVIIKDLLKKEGEPLDKMSNFDKMRVFYVGLSRAKLMTVLPFFDRGKTNTSEEFLKILEKEELPTLDAIDFKGLPVVELEREDLGKNYSYTADYLNYQQCPRKYMIFKKYGFVPSRSQTMFFGSLVHQTIEDLHHLLITERKKKTQAA
jgi:DNA helicase-2/ATP-dependent DNA helicase PcrA